MNEFNEYPSFNFKDAQEFLSCNLDVIYLKDTGKSYQCQQPSKHDYFKLMIFEKGSGINVIDNVEYAIAPLQMHLYFPRQIHYWKLSKDTVVHKVLISKTQFSIFSQHLKHSFPFFKENPVLNLPRPIFNKIITELKQIRNEQKRQIKMQEIIQYRLRIISMLISREVYHKLPLKDKNYPPILDKFLDLVVLKFMTEHSVDFYAKQLGISANYLTILCRKHFASTAKEVINSQLIMDIKYQLSYTEKSVKEIGMDYCIYELSTFSFFFKKHTGLSPRAYRSKYYFLRK